MSKEESSYTVYMHTTPCGKKYIGITCRDLDYRWKGGKGYSRQKYFYSAIQKYGWENIKHEILSFALTKEQAEERERYYIKTYNSANREYGYNIDLGGKSKGRCSEETRRLISSIQKGRKQSAETILKIVTANTGKKRSQETKDKIGRANSGRKFTPEQIARMKASHKPMVFTDEMRKKISTKVKASWTPERRAKASEKFKGNSGPTWSEEQIQWFRDHNRGEMSVLSKRVGQFDKQGNLIAIFGSAREAGRCGFTTSGVTAVCRGEKNSHKGFVWKYIKEE